MPRCFRPSLPTVTSGSSGHPGRGQALAVLSMIPVLTYTLRLVFYHFDKLPSFCQLIVEAVAHSYSKQR
jgi:hypothetical protein